MSYEKNQLAVVGLPLIDPSSRGTFGLHRKWLLGGNFPLLVPARIYKHKRGSEVKIKSKLDTQNMRNIFKKGTDGQEHLVPQHNWPTSGM